MILDQDQLTALRERTCTEEELKELEAYFAQEELPALDDIIESDWKYNDVTIKNLGKSKVDLWAALENKIGPLNEPTSATSTTPESTSATGTFPQWAKIAIGIVALVCMIFLLRNRNGITETVLTQTKSFENTGLGTKEMTLSDGTKVWLSYESKINYEQPFNSKYRVVEVEGEAFFEVAQDARQRPFRITAGGFSGIAQEGHFNVDARPYSDQVRFAIYKERMNFFLKDQQLSNDSDWTTEGEGTVMKFDKTHGHVMGLEIRDSLLNIAWRKNQIGFDEQLLKDVIKELSVFLGTKITCDESVENRTITSKVFKDPTKAKSTVRAIARANNLRFKEKDRGFHFYSW